MIPIDFPGSNLILKGEGCFDLPTYTARNNVGLPFYLTCWKPNQDDIQAIAAGRGVMLKQSGIVYQLAEFSTFPGPQTEFLFPKHFGRDVAGAFYFLVSWFPNEEQVEQIQKGEAIYLTTVGNWFQPVWIFTLDEDGENSNEL